MGCVQSYFKKAHSAGLSPSSTQASENAGLIPDTPTEAAKQVAEDVVITSQDAVREISLDTNGATKTGVGLGPGVAALAATTGTVAILGATADTTLDNVEGAKQVAAEVVNEVKEAAEGAVKDGKIGVEDVVREAEVVVEKAVGGLIKSPFGDNKQSPKAKEVASVSTSPIQEGSSQSENVNKDAILPTSPLAEEIKPEDLKERSSPISPLTDGPVKSKDASAVTSPIPRPIESKETSAVTSPIPQVNKEIGDIKEEATLSLSSLPEDSIPSSIKEDVLPTFSPSITEEIEDSLSKSDKANVRSLSVEQDAGDAIEILSQVQEKAASRPTSGGMVDLVGKKVAGIVDGSFSEPRDASNAVLIVGQQEKAASRPTSGALVNLVGGKVAAIFDGSFPEPPPPEIQGTTSISINQEVDDVVGKVERSIEQEINDPGLLAEGGLPNTIAEFESKIEDIKGTIGSVKGVELSQFSTKVGSIQEAVSPVAVGTAVVKEAAEKASSFLSQTPHIEVSAPSRPQSSDVGLFSATSPVVEASQKFAETIIEADVTAVSEHEKPETQEIVEAVEEKSGETEGVRPTSAQVEEKAEEVVNDVVQTVTAMVTTAATTIQATFRGHQTRQNLRKIADQEELTDAVYSDLDKDADVTLSLDAKSSDTKEELSETAEDSFPPPLHDGDSELLSTSTEKEELQPVVNVTISAEPVDSRAESVVESEKVSEEKTLPSESEHGSLEGLIDDPPRAASVLSESTVSIGDSISAVKGSETNSILSGNEEQGGDLEGKKGAAATTIQASFRGFQTRQNLQKMVDDTQLPVPEPLQDLPFEDVADEDDLPPPPEECDIEPPPPVEAVAVETPRSSETGEKLKKPAGQVSAGPSSSEEKHGDKNQGSGGEMTKEDAAKLALLQRPQQCDELPEHRGEVAVDLQSGDIATDPEPKGDLVNGALNADASSVEVDDSSLSSAATKIQAGARGYLSRKLMKDTFSTTAPSITDSQSVGATLTSDDGFHTSGSLETEVQRQKSTDEQNIGVTAVVIANIAEKSVKSVGNGISGLHEEILSYSKGASLDSQFPHEKKKAVLATAGSENNAKDAVEDKQVWKTLQGEMEEAATKIQSNFRGYRTRQRLHRENAVQVTTSSGTPGTTSESSDAPPLPSTALAAAATTIRSSGEFHDMMVLSPDPPAPDVTSDSWDGVGVGDEDDALARRQASDLGTRLEGHVIAVATPATDAVSAMGKARETTSPKESSVKEMKGARAKAAATKIQAGFRGYKVRKQMKQLQEKKSGPRRRSSVQPTQIVREKITLQDKSATTIQAGVRGFLVRKRRLEEKNAAVKIQAGFRGYKVRRDVKTRAPVEK